ncbi:MAG: DUF3120 domain-containing protein [Cyanobacteriota bacterium]|nr:DUF3120 domain-containing protein [Cyanobacteriota bacterium]
MGRTRLASGSTVTLTGLLVTLPVFVQAPWVRHAPFSAALFTVVLLATSFALAHHDRPDVREFGELLVGFSGSWLAGALFWGWARLHPVCHLPVEAFALPLAIGGLRSRWRLACALYLGSLLGTAATDAVIAATGLMPLWPQALAADANQATELLHQAATTVLQPAPLLLMSITAVALIQLSRMLWRLGPVARVAGAAIATTLVVDGLFLAAALAAPQLSGLI